MDAVLSTKLTKSGQVTLPKAIRTLLGIENEGRVYWIVEGDRAYISPIPAEPPLSVHSPEEFWSRIAEAEADIAAGRTQNAREALGTFKADHGF